MKKFLFKIFGLIIIICLIYNFHYLNLNSSFSTKEIKYNGSNLRVNIDGKASDILPTSGNYYLSSYDCKDSDTVLKWNRASYQLTIENNKKGSSASCYLNFESNPKLSEMPVGSYVKYVGNNGCSGKSCEGQNANYIDDGNKGFCYNSSYQFSVSGWRIAYQKDGSAYLVSAGSPECMCTDSDGKISDNCSGDKSGNISKHIDNLNKIALNYCNADYSYNGVCDSTSAWNIQDNDYQEITFHYGVRRSLNDCVGSDGYRKKSCGISYDLIDNGGTYWFSSSSDRSNSDVFSWYSSFHALKKSISSSISGVRPVLRFHPSVVVIGGAGTYEDPFIIGNNTFKINSGASYINKTEASKVKLDLIGLSNVSQMCVNINSISCSNYVDFSNSYVMDWSDMSDGEKVVYVYYKDKTGKIIASMSQSVILDTKGPANNSISVGSGKGLYRILKISSEDADKMCFSNVNGECVNWVDYDTNYTWKFDGMGKKTVYGFFKDKAGNVSSVSAITEVTSAVEFVVNEDFSDTIYDKQLLISDNGDYPWIVSDGKFQSNNKNIKSSISTSTIQFTPTVDSYLSFDYGISSESGYDKLTIVLESSDISTILVNAISGINTGTISNVELSEGVTYTLKLSYSKDGSGSNGSDKGYIDNLAIQS